MHQYMSTKLPVLIAGGGIAGLAAAQVLAHQFDVKVFERSNHLGESGAGIQLGPNAIRALQSIDAWDAVAPLTSAPEEIHIRSGVSGAIIRRIKLGATFEKSYGAPYRVAHRAGLHGALLDLLRSRGNVDIQVDTEITASDNGRLITGNSFVSGQAVIAADGVNSKLRQQMNPGSAAIKLPMTIFRALMPLPAAAENVVTLWMCPGAHLVSYPIGNDPIMNIVATCDGVLEQPDFASCHLSLRDVIAPVPEWQTWPAVYVPQIDDWHDGATCLIGDAAHGTVPFLAQGAAMALEDAATLKATLEPEDDWPTRFEHFELLRRTRTRKIDQQSRRMAYSYHVSGIAAKLRDTMLNRMPQRFVNNATEWIYRG
jgi:salicylate hydroxylase